MNLQRLLDSAENVAVDGTFVGSAPVIPQLTPQDINGIANLLGVSPKFLWFLSRTANNSYRGIRIPKSGGRFRQVWDPNRGLKFVQKRLTQRLFSRIDKPSHVGAYVQGRSCRFTAEQHAGAAIILSMDLENFFDSTPVGSVRSVLRQRGLTNVTARLIADICTLEGRVPQGAPTSGDVCNLVAMSRLDPHIKGFLRDLPGKVSVIPTDARWRRNYEYDWSSVKLTTNAEGVEYMVYKFPEDAKFVYTRYSDDLDVSCSVALPRPIVDWMLYKLTRFVRSAGYRVNTKKTKVERAGGRQVVLGMVVNQHPNVPRTKYLKYRALIHNCLRTGFDAQASRAGFDSGLQLCMHLVGMVNYMGQVNPAKRDKLLPPLNEAKELHAAQLS